MNTILNVLRIIRETLVIILLAAFIFMGVSALNSLNNMELEQIPTPQPSNSEPVYTPPSGVPTREYYEQYMETCTAAGIPEQDCRDAWFTGQD